MTHENNQNLYDFYWKLIAETVKGVQAKICRENGISLTPSCADDLCPIPVYEEAPDSLLKTANYVRRPTTINWATSGTYDYLGAYIKTYKDPQNGRKHSEIVVTADNYCWARFFAAKELINCFIDDDGYSATNTVELTKSLIDDLVAAGLPRTEPQTIVDEFAWLGAAYYLIPDSWITPIKLVIDELSKTEAENAYFYMAQKIRAPETVLRARIRVASRHNQ